MMQDYEYFIAISLRDKLKEMVKGRVFCEVQNDQLYIEIRTEELGIYKYYLTGANPTQTSKMLGCLLVWYGLWPCHIMALVEILRFNLEPEYNPMIDT